MAWFGYRAIQEWRNSSELLAQQRAEETADLLVRALLRDMRGAVDGILKPFHWTELRLDQPSELVNLVASGFARYPYPETFFAWTGTDNARMVFFARTDRRPVWLSDHGLNSRFPVVVLEGAPAAEHLAAPLAASGAEGRLYSVFLSNIGGSEYQVVTKLLYRDSRRDRVEGGFGFLVRLDWVRQQYFPSLVDQVAKIVGPSVGLSMTVADENGVLVAGARPSTNPSPVAQRRLRPLFSDPTMLGAHHRLALAAPEWIVSVRAVPDPFSPVVGSPERVLFMTAAAGIMLVVGLLLTARAFRANADLAQLRSDFVASVTHELKTPLTTIQTVADTFLLGGLSSPRQVTEYAQILDDQTKRLIRLIDNLLAYSRVTDVSEVYVFEPLDPADLIDDALRRFQPQFTHGGVEVAVEIAPNLPPIRGDHAALALVFDNLIDNALRYSRTDRRCVRIRACRDRDLVRIDVTDRGVGIAPDEISRVLRRFTRGRSAGSSGSGLGLAIVTRVAQDHAGKFSIDSEVGVGTTVSVAIPVMTT
jgi:signal transduction histidine kinase